ncbi:MAG: phenylalanine--tRNA ligase subunit beta [Candidatus Kariarchaeaceae archaeon]|jgi:phenylalanyl-tRNA synthetase beta chain
MPTIDISIEDICRLMGVETLSPEDLDAKIAFAISEVDSEPDGPDENGHTKVAIDVKTSNRPDLWSAEGIARMVRGMLDSPGLPDLSAEPSGFEIDVTEDLAEIRPYIAAAVVRGLKFDDFLIKQMIQLQDKNDFSFGRRRKRTSIGIYNINMIENPIKYCTVDRDFKFTPLQFEEDLTIDEIFEQHPKGIEYESILAGYDRVPMLMDVNNRVLSMPPIINSNDVGRVTLESTDVLVETTGTNRDAVLTSLICVVQALRDRGGKVESVKINYPEGYVVDPEVTPETKLVEMEVDPSKINEYLGTDFSNAEIIELLRKRRNDAEDRGKTILVKAPPWRKDILHWVDISEDVAMAANYNELVPTDAKVVTAGRVAESTEDENLMRELFIGLQLIEVMNYTLSDPEIFTTRLNRDAKKVSKTMIELSNPVTATFSIVRPALIPILLSFEGKNTHVDYPHRIFEVGDVVERNKKEIITRSHAAVMLSGANETYETILSLLDSVLRLLNLDYTLEESDVDLYIRGRSADIVIDGTTVGHLGEIHPQVFTNFGIEVPVSALELDLSKIPGIRCPPYYTDKN